MSEFLERGWKGIWIPRQIWESQDLTMQEKIFLVEIDSLDNENGCFASNKHFADFFFLHNTRVSNIISKLKEKGYINIQYVTKENSKEIEKRIININRPPFPENEIGINNSVRGGKENCKGGINNSVRGGKENCKDSNTYNNINTNNTIDKEEKTFSPKKTKLEISLEEISKFDISENLKISLREFAQYRYSDDKTILSEMTYSKLIKQIGKNYLSEEHLIDSIDYTIEKSWKGIRTREKEGGNNGNKSNNIQTTTGETRKYVGW